jgi:phenol/toluene 2-monooxygenase (NADH) P5/A5
VAYICGSPEFVADTMKALMKARLFPRDIYREDFFDARDKVAGVRSPLLRTS